MFKSKRANIVLALLIAISLWAYVTGSVNPEVSKKFINVPVKIINESSLKANGLAIDSIETDYVDIVVRGTRSHIKELEESDIKVTADMYNRYSGNNYVPLEVNLPKGVELESKSLEKVSIVVGQMEMREYKIGVDVDNYLPGGMALGKTRITPDTTKVYGTHKNLEKVDRVVAKLDVNKLSEDEESYQCDVEIINKNGGEIKFLSAENDVVTVTTRIVMTKEVPVKVNFVGHPAEGFELGLVEYPKKVTIIGRQEAVEDIDHVVAKDVNISGLKKSKTFPLEFVLPEGIKITSDKNLEVSVTIHAPKEKSFMIPAGDISVENLEDGLTAEVLEGVEVIINGKEEIVESIQMANISVVVDAAGLSGGEHKVEVKVSLHTVTGLESVVISTDKRNVDVAIS